MSKERSRLKLHALGIIDLLILQYVLGMLSNLFVSFPNGSPDIHWEFARSQALIILHATVGIFLFLGTLALWIRAYQLKDKVWKIASGIAFGAVVLAFISGIEFISQEQELYSLTMSVFFIIALGAIGWGLYKTRS